MQPLHVTGAQPLRLTTLSLALCIAAVLSTGSFAETRIVMLGTGTPVENPERSGPAVAIVVDDTSYLFDFGPGVVRRAASLSPRFGGEIEALAASNLNMAFLTHLHSDHTAGFADLLLTGWASGKRDRPLKLFGPDGIQALVEGTHAAFLDDIKYRLYHRGKASDQGWRVETQVVQEGPVYRNQSVHVIAFPVLHGAWPNAFGYRVETRDKVIVISGDLRPNDNIRKYSENADYLIHEVYCRAGFERRSPADRAYHSNNHTSTEELARLANQVQPGTLVLTHIIWFGCTADEILGEVAADYQGKVVIANDLDVYR